MFTVRTNRGASVEVIAFILLGAFVPVVYLALASLGVVRMDTGMLAFAMLLGFFLAAPFLLGILLALLPRHEWKNKLSGLVQRHKRPLEIGAFILLGILFPVGSYLLCRLGIIYQNEGDLRLNIFWGILLAAPFLLGTLLGLMPSRTGGSRIIALCRRNRRPLVLALLLGLFVSLVAFVVTGHESGFILAHRYELFWLVLLPAMVASPFLVGGIVAMVRK